MRSRSLLFTFAAVLLMYSSVAAQNISFSQPITSPVTPAPAAFVSGDFNGDGNLDIVTVSSAELKNERQFAVLLGNGDGTFKPYKSYQTPVNSSATAMVAGDFNNDGNLDVAICFIVTTDNQPSSLITIALGNGDGTFKSLFSNQEGWDFRGIAAADFNGDGILDLALTDHTGGYLVVMLGQGDGRFQLEESVQGAGIPLRVLISDFNHDGLPDIAYTVQNHGVVILTGNGDGTFTIANQLDVGKQPLSLAVSDLNGDGNPDLLAGGTLGSLCVSLSEGNQYYFHTAYYEGVRDLIGISSADFNGDGRPDVALIGFHSNVLEVLPGNGDGTLGLPTDVTLAPEAALAEPVSVLTGDFNGDGKPDLAVLVFKSGSSTQGYVAILLNTT